MQDPNEDTEWNDILRRKGIIPPKEEVKATEDEIINMVEQSIAERNAGKSMDDMGLDELNDLEDDIDEEDERMFEQYRRQRMAEMKEMSAKASYGDVREISKADWVTEVNKAGEGIWVVIHVYKRGIPLCALVNQHMQNMARKFPATKFLKGESSVCIPNYPDKNLPTVFVYFENDMKKQFIGPLPLGGMKLTLDEFEWMLSEVGAVKTTLEENPRKKVDDLMTSAIRSAVDDSDSDDGFH